MNGESKVSIFYEVGSERTKMEWDENGALMGEIFESRSACQNRIKKIICESNDDKKRKMFERALTGFDRWVEDDSELQQLLYSQVFC
jgi:hypothetical protein